MPNQTKPTTPIKPSALEERSPCSHGWLGKVKGTGGHVPGKQRESGKNARKAKAIAGIDPNGDFFL